MNTTLLLATRNPGKLREIQALLADLPVEPMLLPADAPEVEETADTFRGNAELKARAAAEVLGAGTREAGGCWVLGVGTESVGSVRSDGSDGSLNTQDPRPKTPYVLAEDSGLEVDALGGAPGVYSARYAGPGASDADCVAKLLDALRDVPEEKRTARFRSAAALLAPDGRLWIVEGALEGRITPAPRGRNGFGYDPVFLVPHLGLTTAELSPEEKNRISHRGQALSQIRDLLKNLL